MYSVTPRTSGTERPPRTGMVLSAWEACATEIPLCHARLPPLKNPLVSALVPLRGTATIITSAFFGRSREVAEGAPCPDPLPDSGRLLARDSCYRGSHSSAASRPRIHTQRPGAHRDTDKLGGEAIGRSKRPLRAHAHDLPGLRCVYPLRDWLGDVGAHDGRDLHGVRDNLRLPRACDAVDGQPGRKVKS